MTILTLNQSQDRSIFLSRPTIAALAILVFGAVSAASAFSTGNSPACSGTEAAPSKTYSIWLESTGEPRLFVLDGQVLRGRPKDKLVVELAEAPSSDHEPAERVSYRVRGDVLIDEQGGLDLPHSSDWRFVDPDRLSVIGSVDIMVDGMRVACVNFE